MKKLLEVHSPPEGHWVGDGFPVRSLFSYSDHGRLLDPFLLLDYAGPSNFEPAQTKRGVGEHPHRGFETVTIVYEGEVDHRDSAGGGGHIGPGDVQWMTAASGLVHEEFHSPEFTSKGGTLEMFQLWVNLPAKDKMSSPGYQTLLKDEIPTVEMPGRGSVRVIAGDYQGNRGPAKTFTPMNVWDVRLTADAQAEFEIPEGHCLALVIRRGEIRLDEGETARASELVIFERDGANISVQAVSDAEVLLLSGEPIEEPVVGYGPFVMNTRQEIEQAVREFNSGKFGRLA